MYVCFGKRIFQERDFLKNRHIEVEHSRTETTLQIHHSREDEINENNEIRKATS